MTKDRFIKLAAKQRDATILDAALTCFNEHGCFHTTLDCVTAEVGIGKGTLYRHYRSREDLSTAALRKGIEALVARCQRVWEEHAMDSEDALRAVIGDLVLLNRAGAPTSPAALARLRCSCQWMNPGHSNHGEFEDRLAPVVRSWQAAGLIDKATDPRWIVAVTMALVSSPAVLNHGRQEPVEANTSPRRSTQVGHVVDHVVHVLRRAFAPGSRSNMAVPEE